MRRFAALFVVLFGLCGCSKIRFEMLCRAHVPDEPIVPIAVDGIELQGFPDFHALSWLGKNTYAEFTFPDLSGERLQDLQGREFLADGLYRFGKVGRDSDACLLAMKVKWGAEQGEAVFKSDLESPSACLGLARVEAMTSQYLLQYEDEKAYAMIGGRNVRMAQTALIDKKDGSEVGRLVHLSMRNELPNIVYVPDIRSCGNVSSVQEVKRISLLLKAL